jgi:hypothetical protein
MALRLSRLLDVRTWRAIRHGFIPFMRALSAYDRGDTSAAIANFEEWLRWDPRPAADYMAFYGLLLMMDHRPVQDTMPIFTRVFEGEFSGPTPKASARYAEAFSHYMLAFVYGRDDVVARWLEAYRLKPKKGFASRYLYLPEKPVLK